jgi:3-oxoacyl-[acyl-carrier protein] reductase
VSASRNALIGGGATGIGRATAARLARDGHRVVIFGRRADALEAAAKELDVSMLVADIAAFPNVAEPPDILVLNAGGPPPGRILDVDDDAWQAGFDLLLRGPLRVARWALPVMALRGFGRVVFVTSTAVRQPQPDLATSVVLRAAVTSAAKLLSREFAAHGVTVNCVAPGPTATDRRDEILAARAARTGAAKADLDAADVALVPAGRAGHPDEIAAAVAFLASDAAGYVNGTVLTVDGGRTETP